MNGKLIRAVHIYILMLMSTGFMVHVLIIPVLLSTSHRDSWVSVIFSAVPFLFWILLVFYLYKKITKREEIHLLLRSKFTNKWIYNLFALLLISYFLLVAIITLKFTYIWAKGNYALDTPDFIIIIAIGLVCYYATTKGLLVISTISILTFPTVSIFGLLVGLGNSPNKNYELLFPLFENGYSSFLTGIMYACSSLFDIIFLLFLTPFIKNKLKAKWLIATGFMLVLLILGPLTGAITEFGVHEAAKLRNPAYEEWRLLKIGDSVTRLDFLSIFQWLSGAFIRISVSMFIIAKMINEKKKKMWILPILYFLLFLSVYIPWDANSFYIFLKDYYFPYSLFIQISILLLSFLLIRSVGEKHGGSTN